MRSGPSFVAISCLSQSANHEMALAVGDRMLENLPSTKPTRSQSHALVCPIGVVLASSPNMHLWPLSRTEYPVQFVRDDDGLSSFQTALLRLQKLSLATNPIVTINAAHLHIAREQLAELEFSRQPHIIVEPVFRGTFSSLAIATLFAARHDRSAMMVVIDAHRPPQNAQGFDHFIGQMRGTAQARNRIIVGVQPLRGNGFDQPLHLQAGAKVGTNHLFEASGQNVPDHLNTLERNGIIIMLPRVGLQALSIAGRTTIDACAIALESSPEKEGIIWPQINMWSSLQTQSIDELLPRATEYIYLRPMDLGIAQPPHAKVRSRENTKLVELGNRLFVLQDCPDLEIIAANDAALIRPRQNGKSIEGALDALRDSGVPHLHANISKVTPWGREDIVERTLNYEVTKLTLDTGQSIPAHFHNHRDEQWTVLEGTGEAQTNNDSKQIKAGDSLALPRTTLHGITNRGPGPLSILETRRGDFLNRADHIRIAQSSANKIKIA